MSKEGKANLNLIILLFIIVVIIIGAALIMRSFADDIEDDTSVSVESFERNNDIDEEADNVEGEEMGEVKEFDISGTNFQFSIKEIRVKKGDKVKINFTSSSGFHDWVVDEFGAATERVAEGNSSSVEFIAGQSGNYEYYCSVGNHRAQGMVGKLVVE